MLEIKGKLTIAKGSNSDEVRIYLDDDRAGCRAVVARVRFDDFARALFAQGDMDCVVQINDSGVVGKVREHKAVEVLVPRDLAFRGNMDADARARALRRIADDCPEAPAFECWRARMDDFDNLHNRGKQRDDSLVPIRVVFERWVDPPAAPSFRCASPGCPGYSYKASDRAHPCPP